MIQPGFWIRYLRATGPHVAPAEVHFSKGLNIITGPSNTGKSYIIKCIDYLLGAKNHPAPILEAKGYDRVSLGLARESDGEHLTLERSLKGGGNVSVRIDNQSAFTLGAKHESDRDDTLSHFLLSLSGFIDGKVRMNKHGKTRSLSFRDLANLILVHEEDIIKTSSPMHTGQFVNKTVEASVFKLVLTGIDDSSILEQPERKIVQSRWQARIEVLDSLLASAKREIVQLDLIDDSAALLSQTQHLEELFEHRMKELRHAQDSVESLAACVHTPSDLIHC